MIIAFFWAEVSGGIPQLVSKIDLRGKVLIDNSDRDLIIRVHHKHHTALWRLWMALHNQHNRVLWNRHNDCNILHGRKGKEISIHLRGVHCIHRRRRCDHIDNDWNHRRRLVHLAVEGEENSRIFRKYSYAHLHHIPSSSTLHPGCTFSMIRWLHVKLLVGGSAHRKLKKKWFVGFAPGLTHYSNETIWPQSC